MRIWSLNPEYLDPAGLVALWREGLLAQKVLLGETRGYKFHPQLARFQACPDPVAAIGCYLAAVQAEAGRRGYRFDCAKIVKPESVPSLTVAKGQIEYEWQHLLAKLKGRAPRVYEIHMAVASPRSHPLFTVVDGGIEEWEKL